MQQRTAEVEQELQERKRAETKMRIAKEAAESASLAKSELLANMSHEIRTPLKGVIGMTELALDSRPSAEQREHLETIKSAAESLLTVINDILNFSKIEAGNMETEEADFSLRGCQSSRCLHILLAEDNHVNQIVAIRTLEKQGHSVVVANNGLEALSLLDQQSFDLVLMDIQMPEMDGLTATKTIRESERQGGSRIPIIAMTAHAMKGDRERCLESGMDGYVSKPISGKALEEAITSAVEGSVATRTRSGSPMPGKLGSWDAGRVLAKLDGNEKLFHELLEIFREESPRNLDKLREAISQGDSETVANIAHSFKGELGYFGISGVCERARELEEMGRRQDLEGAAGISSAMETEILSILNAMQNVNRVGQSSAETGAIQ